MKVIDVTSNQNINKFNKAISMPNKKSIVYFHSPNCGHCKILILFGTKQWQVCQI